MRFPNEWISTPEAPAKEVPWKLTFDERTKQPWREPCTECLLLWLKTSRNHKKSHHVYPCLLFDQLWLCDKVEKLQTEHAEGRKWSSEYIGIYWGYIVALTCTARSTDCHPPSESLFSMRCTKIRCSARPSAREPLSPSFFLGGLYSRSHGTLFFTDSLCA